MFKAMEQTGSTESIKTRNRFKQCRIVFRIFLMLACVFLSPGLNVAIAKTMNLSVLKRWRGDYPVSYLNRLPGGQDKLSVGFIGDDATLIKVWQVFKPGKKVPDVDFMKNLVVYSRNVTFYNRTAIAKVALKDGAVDILTIETRSALPIKDKIAIAMAVIPRAGVRFIQAGNKIIPITSDTVYVLPADPLNASYTIEGKEIRLLNGRHEVEAAPGSATKIATAVFGTPVYGDINGDGDADAVLLLTQDLGGSGTFCYVAVALNLAEGYRGTNAVLLGDRINPREIRIRNGLVVVSYAERRPEEPMSVSPSVAKSKYLILQNDKLTEIKPPGNGERVHEGWVTIGHEVRSFTPCPEKKELWLLGNSPALDEIMASYRQTLTNSKPYTPLFMVIVGKVTDPPKDGFGAEYEAAFFASQVVRVWPKGNCKSELIYLESPLPGAIVASPLKIQGHARGTWFFEGDFPAVLKDIKGNIIAKGYCTAKGDWMTQRFVPFEGALAFKESASIDRGTLILRKNNPTYLPKHDDALEIPVNFK